jgi:Type IV secretion-system coupling protein DNA-binding domain.
MQKHYIKGQKLIAQSDAKRLSLERLSNGETPLKFGEVRLPEATKYNGFFIQGQMRSGKSATISLLMEQAFRGMKDGAPVRGMVYDPKNKATNVLCGLGVPFNRIRIMNPMDKRCWGWDIQKDVTNQLVARGLSRVFIRDRGDADRFWTEAPRGLMSSVMVSFILSKLDREKENRKKAPARRDGARVLFLGRC